MQKQTDLIIVGSKGRTGFKKLLLGSHYCNYRPKHVDDYERHVIDTHPGKMAYSGSAPGNVAMTLYIVESIAEELKLRKRRRLQHCEKTHGQLNF